MVSDQITIDAINEMLHREYRVLDGRPIYRLAWSADQLELRKGKYSEFYGHIFIRERVEIKWIKKYWYLKGACWVLEKLTFIQGQTALKEMQDELVQCGNGTYEPIYTFLNEEGEQLPVVWEIVEYILWRLHNPIGVNPFLAKAAMEAEEEAEVAYFKEKLGEGERSPLFVWENSAFVSTNQLKFKKEMTYTEKMEPPPTFAGA
jgi:hypothetical protein